MPALEYCWRASIALVACIASILALPVARAEPEEEAVRVFRQLKPSVVSLQNDEGSGTGILLQSDGLILTNAHVASSPMPYRVRVDAVMPAGKTATPLVYKKVQVIGYHPRLDLALVRIDPKENAAGAAALKPVTLSKTKGDAGQQVYVIGDPGAGGMILSKSITSGMISSADREFDGEHYYQTDAAINHGNSGGPLCDRNGNVLGLVTFKFEDVHAIGFAIPLHDLDVKSFVPLNQRQVNPKRSQELLVLAKKYWDTYLKIVKEKPDDVAQQRNYFSLVTYCCESALAMDPSNVLVYYDIGVLRSTVAFAASAAAYFARGIQVAPWEPSAICYLELGRALIRQDHEAQAASVWSEGVTKCPYAEKIWEELAIYYLERSRPIDAARCASAAQLVADKDTQLAVLRQLVTNARGKASGAEVAALNEQTTRTYLTAMIDRMVAASNTARAARAVYINRSCATLMAGYGAAPLADIAKTIPQDPLKPWAEWTKAPKTTTRPPTQPVAGTNEHAASTAAVQVAAPKPAESGWVDLVAEIEPKPDRQIRFHCDGTGFSVSCGDYGRVQFPRHFDGSYELQGRFTRPASGTNGPVFYLPAGSTGFQLQVGSSTNRCISLGIINGKSPNQGPVCRKQEGIISPDVEHALDVRVTIRDESADIAVDLDGALVAAWKGPLSALSPDKTGRMRGFCLSAYKTSYSFSALRIRVSAGKWEEVQQASKSEAPLAGATPAAEAPPQPGGTVQPTPKEPSTEPRLFDEN